MVELRFHRTDPCVLKVVIPKDVEDAVATFLSALTIGVAVGYLGRYQRLWDGVVEGDGEILKSFMRGACAEINPARAFKARASRPARCSTWT